MISVIVATRNRGPQLAAMLWLAKRLYYLQLPALICGERRAAKLARKMFVCSDRDRRYLSR